MKKLFIYYSYTGSGELVAQKTFGDPERNSYLYHLVKDSNGHLTCVGCSGVNLGRDRLKYSGWFLKTDMSSDSTKKQLLDTKQDVNDKSINVIDPRMV